MNNKFIEEELKIFKYLFFCFSEKNKKVIFSYSYCTDFFILFQSFSYNLILIVCELPFLILDFSKIIIYNYKYS